MSISSDATALGCRRCGRAGVGADGLCGDCRAELRDAATGTMTHPQIYESGRAFLAARLARLSDKQITDLFTASRVEERGEEMDDIRANAPSKRRKVTVDDWRLAFKVHRDEITRHTCPR